MKLSRRSALMSGGAAAILVVAANPANAALFSGNPSGGGGGLITTMTLKNTGGSTLNGVFISPMFGHPFKKGDITTGTAPVFKTTGGTTIPFSMSKNVATWSDGSLKHAAFMLQVPSGVSITAGSSLTVDIYSGGTVPSASSRSTSDFTAGGLDLNVSVTGQTGGNLTGTWVSDLGSGITAANADNYVYMDGAAGKVWRIRQSFYQSGSPHGQLEGYWFVAALNDGSNNLAGIRHLTRVTQPWYNVNSPAKNERLFSAFGIYNGASQLADMTANLPGAVTASWSGSGANFTATNTFQSGMSVQLSGSLPTGLSTGQTYFIQNVTGSSLALNLNSTDSVSGNSGPIVPTGGATSFTVTPYVMVAQFGSVWTAQTNGRWNYIQGNGSIATDSTLLCGFTNTYWCETKCLAPYALGSYTPVGNSLYTYNPLTAGPVTRFFGNTGERPDIGPLPDWYVFHVFLQSATDEQAVRIVGLVGGHVSVCVRDSSTLMFPVVNNTTYSGMPSANYNFRWYGSGSNYSGWTIQTNHNTLTQGFDVFDSSHIPSFSYYPYLLTGEPQYMDMIQEWAGIAVMQRYSATGTATINGTTNTIGGSRNVTVNSTNYYGIFGIGNDAFRDNAWGLRDVTATAILPSTSYEPVSSVSTYWSDLRVVTLNAINAYTALLPSYANTNGLYYEETGTNGDAWTLGYFTMVVALSASMAEESAALTLLNYIVQWPAHVNNTFGTWCVANYEALIRPSTASSLAPYLTSDSQWGIYGWTMSWASATNKFTLTGYPTGYVLTAGDKFIFDSTQSSYPAACSQFTPYYVYNVSGSTFQLVTDPTYPSAGSLVTLTDTNSGSAWGLPKTPPSTGSCSTITGSGYVANVLAGLNWANAIGGTVDSTTRTNLNTVLTSQGSYVTDFDNAPKYAMQSTFP